MKIMAKLILFVRENIRASIFLYVLVALFVKCILFSGLTTKYSIDDPYFYGTVALSLTRAPFYIGFILIFLCFSFLMPTKKSHFGYLLTINVLMTLLFLADIWYFRGFTTMPSVMVLSQLGNLENLSGSILALMKPIDFILLIDFAFLGIVYKKANYVKANKKFFLNLGIALILVLHIPVANKVFGIRDSAAIYTLLDSNITAFNLSPIGYHYLDAYYYIKESQKLELTEVDKENIEKWYAKQEKTPLMNEPLKGKNLIMVQLESFEDFVLGLKVDNQEVTPNLNKLLEHSYRFTNVHEQVKEGTTSDAEFMINTSLYPLKKGSVFFRYPLNTFPSLPETLEKEGYSTISMHSDSGAYWNWMTAHKSIGFDKQLDSGTWDLSDKIGMGLSDVSFLKQAAVKIGELEKPFYTFLVTLSSHSPFKIPEKDITIKIPENLKDTTMGKYIEAANYTDRAVGEFVKELEKQNLLQDSLLVIYGDHEGVHKYNWDEPASDLYKNDKKVPLILYHPSIQGKEIDTIGGQVDIMPTVLSLLDVEKPKYAMGRDLFTSHQAFAALMNGKMAGQVDEASKTIIKEGVTNSDLIVRSNYLKEKEKN